ncbi:superoxide dismutase family protein [Budvicia diplopodorum]|uniref:superoxide dismutase family protein n=1 Tax=Budvicia diplopodorum TaxID=1119056 RepID=UPI00135BB0FF|nr:superoxide dismutase family protein [Budvicia diplopodorum]
MKRYLTALAILVACAGAQAAMIEVPVNSVSAEGVGQSIGNVAISETEYGLLFTPNLKSLPAGVHGFHIHEKASCESATKDGKAVAALAAGGHFDPDNTAKHLGPYANGHLGDLPAIYVAVNGTATTPVLAPRLKTIAQIKEHALMVHAGGDNHSDHPAPLGGGGARAGCGVIK